MAYETAATRKAKYAASLVPRLLDAYVKGDLERTAMNFAELVRLYPKPRFFLSKERGGLCIYVDEGGHKELPSILLHAAVYIEEERGEAAFVHKNRDGHHGHIEESTYYAMCRGNWIPQEPSLRFQRTWYDWVGAEDELHASTVKPPR